ncbi:MAG: hybrid sensor histidine kinase/response regulator [Arcobacteraceae bacterium]
MFMEHLALTYKCHSSIGNSLDLNIMIKEVLTSFVEETNALKGFFYLIDENNKIYKYLAYDDNFAYDETIFQEQIKDLIVIKYFEYNQKEIILLLPLQKGAFFIVFEKNYSKFEFVISMFQDLIVKLNISIDACLNVQKIKNKNKMLNHLTNELKEQQKQLLESDKYKSNFLANMSHELKTPLNSIIVISSIMAKNRNQKLDDEQIKNMKIINSCGNDLLILINDILDISKIEAGELSINLSKINLFELLENLVLDMQPLANEKGLAVNYNSNNKELFLLSDLNRIKQIVKNLMSNAIKFTDKGSIEIILEENINDIIIKIIDEGIGISKEKLDYIFERFKQADGSTTRKYGGTGLGLSISKELASLLGGEIKAFSTLGQGSTFELILPKKTNIKNISDDKVTISSKNTDIVIEDIILFDMDESLKQEDNIIKKDEKLLIINSDYVGFFPIAVLLRKQNFILTYCKSFEEAYDILKDKYDLVIIDEDNSDLDIFDFLDYCKEKELKKIVISSENIEEKDYLKKQLMKNELMNKILTYLGR